MEDFSVKHLCDEVKSMNLLEACRFLVDKSNDLDDKIGSNSKEYKPYLAQMIYLRTFVKSLIWFMGNKKRPAEIDNDNDYLLMEKTSCAIFSNNIS